MDIALLDIAILFIDRLALALILAASLAGLWLRTHAAEKYYVTNSLKYTIDISLLLLLLSTTLVLLLRTASLADVSLMETFPYIEKVIEKSHYGVTWIGRVVALTVIIIVWLISRQKQTLASCSLMIIAATSIAFFISGASHAGEDGLWAFENINNSLHIVGGCFWGGSVIVYALFIKQLNQQHLHITDIANQLSFIATIALATVIATGLLNTWFRLSALSDLWTSDYGLALVVKLIFVFIMMNIGALNRFVLIPRLISHEVSLAQSEKGIQPANIFGKTLYFDSLVFIVIIVLAVALATLSPNH